MSSAQALATGGVPLWTNSFNGPGNNDDRATALAVDHTGNVFVTGFSYVSGHYAYATVGYSGAGLPLWTNYYSAVNVEDEATAIATDLQGNVIVSGQSQSGLGNYDFATLAYSSSGVSLWTNRFNPGPSSAVPSAIATDMNGNVFVAGYAFATDGSGSYYATLAYSSSGAPLWTNNFRRAPGPGDYSGDVATALAVDLNGNILVTGRSGGVFTNYDYATIKYSNTGTPLWTNRYSGTTNRDDKAFALAVDSRGNVFVTGYSFGTNVHRQYATVAYSDEGTPLWTNRYASPGGDDEAAAIAVDSHGNVFVTGTSLGTNGYNDSATLAYSSAGQPLWTNRFARHMGKAIAVDREGNAFVTGGDYVTVAYSGAGVLLWTNHFAGVGNGGAANSLALDSDGNLFVTGGSIPTNFSYDYATIKYSPTVRPSLQRAWSDGLVVLSWSDSTFGLQSAPAVTDPFTNILGATSPYTNSTTAPQQFFRLISK